MQDKIKVLVADDSTIMRIMLSDILTRDKKISITGMARNGQEVIDQTYKDKPDVIVMDLNMGEYGGLYALEEIMKTKPTPVVMVSSISKSDTEPVTRALKLGAFDFINKPVWKEGGLKEIGTELVNKVMVAATSELSLNQVDLKPVVANHTFSDVLEYQVVVIGASTGGPSAVETVLHRLPENLAVPVLVAQHMPENFIPSFVKRLNTITPLQVEVGRHGTVLQPRKIYVAPGGRNMVVRRKNSQEVEISFTNKTFRAYNYPSIDALMTSAVSAYGSGTIGVVLTGMGKDGTEGVTRIKRAGGLTIAQDEATSVVFGMPKEAIGSGNVDYTVPINEIGFFLVSSLS